MGRRAVNRPLGLLHNKANDHQGNTFLDSIRNRINNPHRTFFPIARTALTEFESNEETRKLDLKLIEERREMADIKILAYQQKVAELHNKQIRKRSFKVGDLVLRELTTNTENPIDGKLGPTWEEPYVVIKVYNKGAY